MAVSPNSRCETFCIWLQATAWLKITASQDVIIEQVKDAAAASGTVTEHVWNEFLRTTGLWYQYYVAYLEQTSGTAILPSGIVQGDTLYGSANNVLSRLAKTATASSFLKNSGTNNNPAWVRPAVADLSDYVGWTDFSGTSNPQGFTGALAKNVCRYTKLGKTLFMMLYIQGTSNATTFTFTLPFTSANTDTQRQLITIGNSGVAAMGVIQPNINSTTCNVYRDLVATAFTTSGTKLLLGNFQMEVQ